MTPRSNRRRAAITWTIGTARPSAQGQVMMSTEIATVTDWCQSRVARNQPAKESAAMVCTTGE